MQPNTGIKPTRSAKKPESDALADAAMLPKPRSGFGLNDLLGATAKRVKPSHCATPMLLVRSPTIAVRAPRDNPPDLAEASTRSLAVVSASRRAAEAELPPDANSGRAPRDGKLAETTARYTLGALRPTPKNKLAPNA
ncbi:hypothetical protein GCM10027191_09030 [Novilysobacter erysipheiresistens]